MTLERIGRAALCAAWLALALPASATTDAELAQEDRIKALERKVEVLTSELERTRTDLVVPEEKELVSVFGLGPGASKIYGVEQGLSIGGYAEAFYRGIVDDKRESGATNGTDFLRAVLYAGYKFTDNIIFNMELEFEHASTSSTESSGGGSVSVEFAALDFLWKPWLNMRAGMLLVPVGIVNEVHEPPFFLGVNRTDVETRIIPSTWRENGVGIFGQIGEELEYNVYVVNGLNAVGFDQSGLRGGRQKGNRALAEHIAFVTSLNYTPIPEVTVGGSFYVGGSGQDQRRTNMGVTRDIPDTMTTIWEVHGTFERAGLHLESLFAMAHLGDAGNLSSALGPTGAGGIDELGTDAGGVPRAVASTMLGLYSEISYEIMQWIQPESMMTIEPFFRYEFVDTQNKLPSGNFSKDRSQVVITTFRIGFTDTPNV